MHFTAAAAALVAFAASVVAQTQATEGFAPVSAPAKGSVLNVGSTTEIKWDDSNKRFAGAIDIELVGGSDNTTLLPLFTIASNVDYDAESYSWNVNVRPEDKYALYGLKLTSKVHQGVFQWSAPFEIKGTGSQAGGAQNAKQGTSIAPGKNVADAHADAHASASASASANVNANVNGDANAPCVACIKNSNSVNNAQGPSEIQTAEVSTSKSTGVVAGVDGAVVAKASNSSTVVPPKPVTNLGKTNGTSGLPNTVSGSSVVRAGSVFGLIAAALAFAL